MTASPHHTWPGLPGPDRLARTARTPDPRHRRMTTSPPRLGHLPCSQPAPRGPAGRHSATSACIRGRPRPSAPVNARARTSPRRQRPQPSPADRQALTGPRGIPALDLVDVLEAGGLHGVGHLRRAGAGGVVDEVAGRRVECGDGGRDVAARDGSMLTAPARWPCAKSAAGRRSTGTNEGSLGGCGAARRPPAG